ncbi:HetZ-related protein 2 [Oscillatoriales cyanobacterium LEGE 11467]|uniref:HetZ-related protein 2 n=1 Tax=Zarconia navalis LEGE 11467 TaxID=1828826 RepID=A0A928Z7E0_9CYAN|nr:HetZ-related protein 2 [Zarconia navalis]MBE9039294.1 HetZ-related protein 2 [Zarconia navalis LEGE 11467]
MAKDLEIAQKWLERLQTDYPDASRTTHEGVVRWSVGENSDRLNQLSDRALEIVLQSMEFRYSILQQRYLGVTPDTAYQNLIRRLGGLVLLRNKIRTWVALSRDRHRSVINVVQEIVQELLNSDRYLQQQMAWISQCTRNERLRNSLLLASVEEYCLRPIRNQPLLVYRFLNYLRRSGRGGLTQFPTKDLIRLVSAEVGTPEREDSINLVDAQTLTQYEDRQAWEERQVLRLKVQQEFETYLEENVDPIAAKWLRLYLQGYTQEAIASTLEIPISKIYRLREKVGYHAIRVFALKQSPDLVSNWLETSLKDHCLGLTPTLWEQYRQSLDPQQREILDGFRSGRSVEAIARELDLKPSQVMTEWSKLYLGAHSLRNET